MPRRYHPLLVALHWLLAVFLIGALGAGALVLAPLANSDPAKMTSFAMHMGLGGTILILTVLRLVLRLSTAHPPRITTGIALADRLAPLTHWALYALVLITAVSGAVFSARSGLPDAVFGTGPMPESFTHPARAVHGIVSKLLLALIVLHVAAALWHQYVRRDGIMTRMWFGPR